MTMTINPAAGPLIDNGELPRKVAMVPPMIAVRTPAIGGNPLAIAIPRDRGRAMRKTKKPDFTSCFPMLIMNTTPCYILRLLFGLNFWGLACHCVIRAQKTALQNDTPNGRMSGLTPKVHLGTIYLVLRRHFTIYTLKSQILM
jgi:hypothetical protein